MRFLCVLILACLALTVLALPLAVSAQAPGQGADTPTPTPAGTPAYWDSHTLSSGSEFVIERRATFGELFVALSVLALLAVFVLRWTWELVVRWIL